MRIKTILGLALSLRLAVVCLALSLHPPDWLYSRAPDLDLLAKSLSQGRGFNSPFGGNTGPTAFIAPGYPALVAIVFHFLGRDSFPSAAAIMSLQAAFGALTVLAVMHAARTTSNVRVANTAGVVAALSLPLLWQPAIFWETSLSTLSLIGIIALALRCQQRPTALRWILIGIAGALATLVNPALALVMLGILYWGAWQARPEQRRWPIVGSLVMLAILTPWTIRNLSVLHNFIPLRSNFGFELWLGNHDGATGMFEQSLFPLDNRSEYLAYQSKGELAYMRDKSELAKSYICTHPFEFARTTARRVAWFWFGSGGETNSRFVQVHTAVTSLLGLVGIVMLFRKQRATSLLFLLPLAIFPLPYYITHADYRFRMVLDPLLIVLATDAGLQISGDVFLKINLNMVGVARRRPFIQR